MLFFSARMRLAGFPGRVFKPAAKQSIVACFHRIPLRDFSFVGKWTWHMLPPTHAAILRGRVAAPLCDRMSLFEEIDRKLLCAWKGLMFSSLRC